MFIPPAGRTSTEGQKLNDEFQGVSLSSEGPIVGILTNPHSHRRDNSEGHSMYLSYLIWKLALSIPVAK